MKRSHEARGSMISNVADLNEESHRAHRDRVIRGALLLALFICSLSAMAEEHQRHRKRHRRGYAAKLPHCLGSLISRC
jgi:hypothetical protein